MKLIDYPKVKPGETGFENRTFGDSFEYLLTAGVKNAGKLLTDINERIYEFLRGYQIPIAYESKISPRVLRFNSYSPLPVVVKVTNFADGKIAGLLGIDKYGQLIYPLTEFYLPEGLQQALTENHLLSSGRISGTQIQQITKLTSRVNIVLKGFFERRNLLLGSFVLLFSENQGEIFVSANFLPNNLKLSLDPDKNTQNPVFKKELSPKLFLQILSQF